MGKFDSSDVGVCVEPESSSPAEAFLEGDRRDCVCVCVCVFLNNSIQGYLPIMRD